MEFLAVKIAYFCMANNNESIVILQFFLQKWFIKRWKKDSKKFTSIGSIERKPFHWRKIATFMFSLNFFACAWICTFACTFWSLFNNSQNEVVYQRKINWFCCMLSSVNDRNWEPINRRGSTIIFWAKKYLKIWLLICF